MPDLSEVNLVQEPDRTRRRVRFTLSLRVLMLIIFALACGFGWYVNSVRIQKRAIAAIKRAGGSFTYNWEWGNYDANIIDAYGKPRAPKWLAKRLDVDYVASVDHVNLVPHHRISSTIADDKTLASVGNLSHVESLWLTGSAVTDAGMADVAKIAGLRDLQLMKTAITDVGLKRLRGLSKLRSLSLEGTKVTDDGVLELERTLPRLQIFREENLDHFTNIPRAMKDLEFARTRPIRLACLLLATRAQRMAANDEKELFATARAVCELEASDKVSLVRIANACAACVRALEGHPFGATPSPERDALLLRCANRGVEALTRAADLGYRNSQILQRIDLWPLSRHPGFDPVLKRLEVSSPTSVR